MSPRRCSSPDCDRPASSRGLCVGHYARLRAGKSTVEPLGAQGPVPGEPREQVTTHLLAEDKRALERHAKAEGLSVYALLRRIVEEWLRSRPAR